MTCIGGKERWPQLWNDNNDSPCDIAPKVNQYLDCQGPHPTSLPPGSQYPIPTPNSTKCVCSSAYYYAISACALCQQGTWPSWASWSSNCIGPITGPYNNLDGANFPQYVKQSPNSNPTFVDPKPPAPIPTTTPLPTTTPTPSPTRTTTPTSTDVGDQDTSVAPSSPLISSSDSMSGTTASVSTSPGRDNTSTITLAASSRSPLATGAAGFSADPNDPNNPSPSISPLDGSTNAPNGALAERKGSNAGAIVGGIIGAIAFIILLGGVLYWLRTRRRRGSLAPSAAYMATYGRPDTGMSQRPYTDRSVTPLHSMYPEPHSPYNDDLRESVHSYNMEGVTAYNGPQRTIGPQTYPTR